MAVIPVIVQQKVILATVLYPYTQTLFTQIMLKLHSCLATFYLL